MMKNDSIRAKLSIMPKKLTILFPSCRISERLLIIIKTENMKTKGIERRQKLKPDPLNTTNRLYESMSGFAGIIKKVTRLKIHNWMMV